MAEVAVVVKTLDVKLNAQAAALEMKRPAKSFEAADGDSTSTTSAGSSSG